MKDSSGLKSSAESKLGRGGSSGSGILAFRAMFWGYDVVLEELWVLLWKWVGLPVAFRTGRGSGWLVGVRDERL